MAISNLYNLDKVVMPSSVEFHAISRQSWSAEVQAMVEYLAGQPHPQFVAQASQKPMVGFTTPELAVALANIGVSGASVATIDTYLKAKSVTGNVARATTSHKRLRMTSCCVYWTQIRLPHNGKAEIDVVVMAVFDGSNDPIAYTGSLALPGNLSEPAYFTLGPTKINGTEIPGVQDVTIDSGVQLLQAGSAGELWDTFVGIQQTQPMITIRTFEEINWSSTGLVGAALNGSTGVQQYARKMASKGTRVANGTGAHCLLTGLNGMVHIGNTEGQGNSPISDTIRAILVAGSDSLLPLTASVTATIS